MHPVVINHVSIWESFTDWKYLSRKKYREEWNHSSYRLFAVLNLLTKPPYDQLVTNVMRGWSGYFSIRHKIDKSNLFQSPIQVAQKVRILYNWWVDNTSVKLMFWICVLDEPWRFLCVHLQITDQEIIDSVTLIVFFSLSCPFSQNFKLCEDLATIDGLGNSGLEL